MSILAKEKAVILLEEKDFVFTENEIDRIVELHNNGIHFTMIATKIKRDPVEILLALIHVADEGQKEIRQLAYAGKPKTEPIEAVIGTESIVSARVIKTRKKKATVIEIDGDRFVFEPKGR